MIIFKDYSLNNKRAMTDSDNFDSCSHLESLSYLPEVCSQTSTNNTTICQNVGTLMLFLKIDCYISLAFYPITASLIIIGTILNLFSLYCFLKMNKRNPQNFYLLILSMSDTLNLHINFTLPILRQSETFDDYFRSLNTLCRLTGVLTEFFLIFPTWIVVLLTVERLICLSYPLKRRSFYTQTRAKRSILILTIIVFLLSLYRLRDLKGIDQGSVFSVVACNGTNKPVQFIRNMNLIIWAILPECLTLIMNLIIVYQIKSATQKYQPSCSKAHQLRYNQATKTVLFISVLFLCFHTPTGRIWKFVLKHIFIFNI